MVHQERHHGATIGGRGRGPFEVDYSFAASIGIMLSVEKFTGDRTGTFMPITFDRKEIETWERWQSVRLIKTHHLICNMTYSLCDLDLR